jgi:alkylhydroperoxidase family enzyme
MVLPEPIRIPSLPAPLISPARGRPSQRLASRRHLTPALDAGLTERERRLLASWPEVHAFNEGECAALRLVDEQLGQRTTSDATVAAVRRHYGDGLLVELLATLGWCAFAATVMVPLDLAADDPPDDLVVPFAPAKATF